MRRLRWCGGLAWAGILLVALVAGCSGQPAGAPDGSSRPPSLSAPSSSGSQAAAQSALDAYRGMWAAYVEASNSGATAPASLNAYAADSALSTLNKGLANNRIRGVTSRGNAQISPTVASASPPEAPTSVKIHDCLDDTNWLLYKPDGQLADNDPGGRRKVAAQVDLRPQGWRVTLIGVQGVGTCA